MTILGSGYPVMCTLSFFFLYRNAFGAFLKQDQKNYALWLDIGLGAESGFTGHLILDDRSVFPSCSGDYPKMDTIGCFFFR